MGVNRPLLSTVKGGAVLFPLLAGLLSACAGPSTSMRRKIDERLAALGGRRLIERTDCDLDFAMPAAKWIANRDPAGDRAHRHPDP